MARPPYPETPREPVVENRHGIEVTDPYRWLEDSSSPRSQKWIEAQAELTREYLSKLPGREPIAQRLTELWDHDKHGLPEKAGQRLFYSRKTGLQNQAVHYWREAREDAPETVLVDPNVLSADGTVAVAGSSPSPDGKWFAYGLSRSGSDWEEWHVIDVERGTALDDELKWVKFSDARWAADNRGFYYSRYAAPPAGEEFKQANSNHQIFFHRLRSPQSDDRLVYSRPDHPRWLLRAGETDDGRFLAIHVSQGAAARNAWFFRRLDAGPDSPVVELLGGFDARYEFVGHDGDQFYFLTDRDAPRGRLVSIDIAHPAPDRWRTIIAPSQAVLQSISHFNGRFVVQSLLDAHDEVKILDRDGRDVVGIPLPDFASAMGFGGREVDSETFYAVTGYARPPEIRHLDVTTGQSRLWRKTEVKAELSRFVTRQMFFTSADGTRIPMFVSHARDLEKNGRQPTILYGYGGFNITLGPGFSPNIVAWMEKGGVYAVANLRGGGEFGEEWHQAGQRLNKQNVFDDFIAAAEFLIAEKFTSSDRLAISGGSNGGLLVAACLLRRPELFAAAAPAVGVHDLLRFHKWTIGWAWQDEYGHPDDNSDDFRNLLRLSPYHNVKPGVHYPPTLIATADHDDRVFPGHSFKFGAALQAAQGGEAPVLLRIERKAGHGAGTPTSKVIARTADEYAFFAHAMGLNW